MRSERVLRFAVPSREVLDAVVAGPLPDGLVGEPVEVTFFRDVYYDTPSRDLEHRGATVRVRVRRDGSLTLNVDVRERGGEGQEVVRTQVEETVADVEVPQLFAGATEPARLLRALVDPSRLLPQLELETSRRARPVRADARPERRLLLEGDAVTLRVGETSAEYFELEVHLPAGEDGGLDELVRSLVEGRGLRVTLAGKRKRAQEVLDALEIDRLEQSLRSAREVAVLVQHGDEIAFRRDGELLRIPTGQGSGEEACRQVLRAHFGRTQGRVRLLGISPGLSQRPAVQVWLAQRVFPNGRAEAPAGIEWIPLDEAVQLLGLPVLRDPSTLAALNTAVRAGLGAELLDGWSGRSISRTQHPFQRQRDRASARAFAADDGVELDLRKKGGAGELLLNPDLSDLAFNERVLALAEDPRTPLLERVRFVSILGSNLDGFFMTRVAGFQQQVASGSTKRTLDGLTPQEQLDVIGVRARLLFARAYDFLWSSLVPELEQAGIQLLDWSGLEEPERAYLRENYALQLGAVLTPLAADPSHPFPHIRNLRPALGAIVRVAQSQSEHFAAIEIPGDLPRFVPLPGGRRFIPLEKVICAMLPELYSGLEVVAAHVFRVTRSANFSLDDETVSDLLAAVEEKVLQRPLGPVVRLEVEDTMPEQMRTLLLRELQFEPRQSVSVLREDDVYPADRLVDLFGLHEIAALPIEALHYPPLQRATPLKPRPSIWRQLRKSDVLVHYPHHSFETTVERMLNEAARDPDVLSVKITLYRTSRSSRVVKLLRKARRNGKDVAALVELKASFDERRNIEWARMLESSGIHVVFSPAHLKVHAKICLVVRREGDEIRRYMYIGTGNLNAATAAAYTDLGLLTCNPELGEELHDVFNGLTGYSARREYRHLLVAPFNMRTRFLEMIEREAEHARAGRGGQLRIKINGLTDREIIEALYRASMAGVRIDLIVRGLCALRPGVEGLSENIRVVSILGRFLEHSRIFRFENAGDPEYFIGSGDWRPRNLSQRVEVDTPVHDPAHRATLDEILESNLQNPDAWELQPDGSYVQRTGAATPSVAADRP